MRRLLGVGRAVERVEVPHPESPAEIRTTEESIAADGPITAAVLSALDVPTLLVDNRIGNDDAGERVGR